MSTWGTMKRLVKKPDDAKVKAYMTEYKKLYEEIDYRYARLSGARNTLPKLQQNLKMVMTSPNWGAGEVYDRNLKKNEEALRTKIKQHKLDIAQWGEEIKTRKMKFDKLEKKLKSLGYVR